MGGRPNPLDSVSIMENPASENKPRTSIRDNRDHGSAGEYLADNIRPGSALSIVSAYFTIYAYQALKHQLDRISGLRFLFGEPAFVEGVDPARKPARAFVIDQEGLRLDELLTQKAVARECAEWIERKVRIRSITRSNLLHGKLYHVNPPNGDAAALVGSSNFTKSGLGFSATPNIELNLAISDPDQCADLLTWFDSLWSDRELTKDVKADVLKRLAEIYAEQSPEFVYYKTLFHVFGRVLDQAEGSWPDIEPKQLFETEIWKALYEFQKDGVKGVINRILRHNGCILADSVGLGKTYEALAVIKYFELRNERVLVLCPKKLRENWTVYQAINNSKLNPFPNDRFAYVVLCHTDLSRDRGFSGGINLDGFNWGAFDLVVIDESHNFRNNTKGRRNDDGTPVRLSRYERLMEEILKSGVNTKVLLLSATPVNNDLLDLRNQVWLITQGNDTAFADTMSIRNITEALRVAQRAFAAWSQKHEGSKKDIADLMNRLNPAFFTMMDELTIARSREHIRQYYSDTLAAIGSFPERPKPRSITCPTDTLGEFPSYAVLKEQIEKYELHLFRPSSYLLEEAKERYKGKIANFTQADRERFLAGMMKVNFLKRLESSVHSFSMTLTRTVKKMDDLEKKIRAFRERREAAPDLDLFTMDPDLMEEEDREAFAVGSKLKINLADIKLDAWLAAIDKDRASLVALAEAAGKVDPSRDAKLAKLRDLIRAKVESPTTDMDGNPNRKVLVFTAFADTAQYLYANLAQWARQDLHVHIALVSGGDEGTRTTLGRNAYADVLSNFSPRSKQRSIIAALPQDEEIDILIATDCISEGQNLQDCDYVINYDIHWNPVRIIQRFGRIDRIGSRSAAVQMVNFWPMEDLDQYIRLRDRVEARMALVDLAATGQDDVLNVTEAENAIAAGMSYRDQQLIRLRDEVLDIEDVSEGASLSDFTLDDFRMDLYRYLQANREALERAPLGVYAVVPSEHDTELRPGIVFCLRQVRPGTAGQANPLHPYYLVYVRDDGHVRYNFTHPKQTLDLLRRACWSHAQPLQVLCDLINARTDDGRNVDHESQLLTAASKAIVRGVAGADVLALTRTRGAVITPDHERPKTTEDFELVTWFVVVDDPEDTRP